MPVEAQTVEYSYLGDGVSTVFQFPSRFLSNDDLLVALNGVLQVTGFTVTGAGAVDGGEVTFSVAPASAAQVVIVRSPPISQLLDFENGQSVLEGTLDNGLDKLTMIAQFLLRRSGRTIRMSDFDVSPAVSTLPLAADRANMFLGFDANGDLTVNAPTGAALTATEAEAEAGTDNSKLMTALRTRQAFAVLTDRYNAVWQGGVDNTGATDAIPALAAAEAAARAAGKTLYLPAGVYKFSSAASLQPGFLSRIEGAPGAIIRRTIDTIMPAVWIKSGAHRTQLERLIFEYTGPSATVSGTHCAVYNSETDECFFHDLRATGGFYVAFNVSDTVKPTFRDCRALGFVNRGFYINAGQGGTTSGVTKTARLYNCHADGFGSGFYGFNTNAFGTGSGDDILFDGCSVINVAQHGFSATERMANVKFSNCDARDSNVNFLVQLANGFRNQRAKLIGCSARGGLNGFYLTQSDYAILDSCDAFDMTGAGFRASDCLFVDHINCKSLQSTTSSGFVGTAASLGSSQKLSYAGCVANINTGFGFTTDANCTYSRVTSCTAVNNAAGQIDLVNGTAVTANNITV